MTVWCWAASVGKEPGWQVNTQPRWLARQVLIPAGNSSRGLFHMVLFLVKAGV